MPTAGNGAKRLIDGHVHLAALDDGSNGCHLAGHFQRSLAGRLLRLKLGLPPGGDAAALNRIYLDKLLGALRSSRFVARALVLALDAVHREDGSRELAASSLVTSNDYVLKVCREHPELLPAASVHPYRKDALDELHRVRELGAVALKLLPVSQIFDPSDPRLKPYWRICADLRMPLIIHTGYEFTLKAHVQRYGDPALLEPALGEGATVIAAHACSRGLPLGEVHLATFRRLAQRYPEFLADTAALTVPSRFPMLLKLRREPLLRERLVYATDYPVPPTALGLVGRCGPRLLLEAVRESNPFDKPVLVMRALGLEPSSDALARRIGLDTCEPSSRML